MMHLMFMLDLFWCTHAQIYVYTYIYISIITSSDTPKTHPFYLILVYLINASQPLGFLPCIPIHRRTRNHPEDSDALTDGFKMRRGAIEAGVSLITDIKTVPWQLTTCFGSLGSWVVVNDSKAGVQCWGGISLGLSIIVVAKYRYFSNHWGTFSDKIRPCTSR